MMLNPFCRAIVALFVVLETSFRTHGNFQASRFHVSGSFLRLRAYLIKNRIPK